MWKTVIALGSIIVYGNVVREIDQNSDLKSEFRCQPSKGIGGYNEYYQTCVYRYANNTSVLKIQNRKLDLEKDLDTERGVRHVELYLSVQSSEDVWGDVYFGNASICASGIEIHAKSVFMDKLSYLNASVRGLKYGPGYAAYEDTMDLSERMVQNDTQDKIPWKVENGRLDPWRANVSNGTQDKYAMSQRTKGGKKYTKGIRFGSSGRGSAFGGLGGLSLAEATWDCQDLPRMERIAEIGNTFLTNGEYFRNYGSGGGLDSVRGGGFINITITNIMNVSGRIEANGGSNDEYSNGAGSGGGIQISCSLLSGSGTIQALGGNAYPYDQDALFENGGGGGGGGGRIVLKYDQRTMEDHQISAFGGKQVHLASKASGNCQVGSGGTILLMQTKNNIVHQGALLLSNLHKPTYAATPILFQSSDGIAPDWLTNITISDHGVAMIQDFMLPTSSNSRIVVDSNASIQALPHIDTINIKVSEFAALGLIGYDNRSTIVRGSTKQVHINLEADNIVLQGGKVVGKSIRMKANTSFVADRTSLLSSKQTIEVQANNIMFNGWVEPNSNTDGATVKLTLRSEQDTDANLQSSGIDWIRSRVHAMGQINFSIPRPSPFTTVFLSGENININGNASGTPGSCAQLDTTENICAADTNKVLSAGYGLTIVASKNAIITNIKAGSMLVCSGNITIRSVVGSSGLGCPANQGPGKSHCLLSVSGGAGHGGFGGNVSEFRTSGGLPYDSMQHPNRTGSGACSVAGHGRSVFTSAGGGIIALHSNLLHMENQSVLSAAGTDGSGGTGGGSGGTIVLYIDKLFGNGTINAAGGCACANNQSILSKKVCESCPTTIPSNVVNVYEAWRENRTLWHSGYESQCGGGGGGGIIKLKLRMNGSIQHDGTRFLNDGGRILLHGGASAFQKGGNGITARSKCIPGTGNLLCTPCELGEFSPNTTAGCLPCNKGSFSNKPGSAVCTNCTAGQFAPEARSSACTNCAAGSFSNVTMATNCTMCPKGQFANATGSTTCQPCAIGAISNITGTINCTICGLGFTTRYKGSTRCSYCHHKPPHSSFDTPGLCTFICDKGRTGIECLTPFERLVKPIGGPLGFVLIVFGIMFSIFGLWGFVSYKYPRNIGNQFDHRLEDEIRQRRPKKGGEFYEDWKRTIHQQEYWARHTFTPRLHDNDLKGHLDRVYFYGQNSFSSPWRLPHAPSIMLEPQVYGGSYEIFAKECEKVMAWEKDRNLEYLLHRTLCILCPPLAVSLLTLFQHRRIQKLGHFVDKFKGGFFRDLDSQSNGIQIKLGFSPCYTLGYIDIIWIGRIASAIHLHLNPGKLPLPYVFCCAGFGTFTRPYYLDTNDLFVRSMPSRLHMFSDEVWVDFIAQINASLCTVSHLELKLNANALGHVQRIVQSFSSKYCMDEIHLRIGYLSLTKSFVDIRDASSDERFENIAFAFLKSKCANSDAALNSLPIDKHHDEDSNSTTGSASYLLNVSGIRQQALFSNETTLPLHQPILPTTQTGSRENRWMSHLVRYFRKCTFKIRNYIHVGQVRHTTHRYSAYRPVLLLLILCLDTLSTFLFLMETSCIQVQAATTESSGCSRVTFVLTLLVYPGALVISPLLGLYCFLYNGRYRRLHMLWHLCSFANMTIGMIFSIFYFEFVGPIPLCTSLVSLLLKHIFKIQGVRTILEFEGSRPRRGWRGLHTTTIYYDSSINPLVEMKR